MFAMPLQSASNPRSRIASNADLYRKGRPLARPFVIERLKRMSQLIGYETKRAALIRAALCLTHDPR